MPELTKVSHRRRFRKASLLRLLRSSNVNAPLNEGAVFARLLTGAFQRELRIAAEHLLAQATMNPVAKNPRGLAVARCGRTGHKSQAFSNAAVGRAARNPCLQFTVGERALLSVDFPPPSRELWGSKSGDFASW